jgi:hypothetical protein
MPLGYGGSVVCLPPLVRTLNTCSRLVAIGATADNFDSFDCSLALKIAWSFKILEKLSILKFMSFRILS